MKKNELVNKYFNYFFDKRANNYRLIIIIFNIVC